MIAMILVAFAGGWSYITIYIMPLASNRIIKMREKILFFCVEFCFVSSKYRKEKQIMVDKESIEVKRKSRNKRKRKNLQFLEKREI